jgi:flagellar operon protein
VVIDQVRVSPAVSAGGCASPAGAAGSVDGQTGRAFANVLGSHLGSSLRFSRHAEERLASRNVPLSESQRERLAEATRRAESSGAREALLLMGNMAFIVSVPNRTVITALDGSRMEAGVITGIDAAVMVPGEVDQ